MNNKKGFTLIELLAIIVILAVIMAIAIPQVLNVVNGSKDSAWKDNVKMISKSIELNTQLFDPETGNYTYTIDSLCKNPNNVNKISKSTDTKVTCSGNVFTINGINQFDGKTATIDCRNGSCKTTFTGGASDSVSKLAPGLYDGEDNLLASWDSLVNDYGLDIEKDNSTSNYVKIVNDNPGLLAGKKLVLGDISRIGSKFFEYVKLDYIEIPASVTSIGDSAFEGCNVKKITFAENSQLTTIEDYAFLSSFLRKLEIPDSVTEIGKLAFSNVMVLIYYGNAKDSSNSNWGAEYLNPYLEGDFAYEEATKEKILRYVGFDSDVVIPDGVTNIDDNAFYDCYYLISVEIPASVVRIGDWVFSECMLLSKVTIAENSQLTTIGEFAFDTSSLHIIETLYIPASVTTIGASAFTSVNHLYYSGPATDRSNWGANTLN